MRYHREASNKVSTKIFYPVLWGQRTVYEICVDTLYIAILLQIHNSNTFSLRKALEKYLKNLLSKWARFVSQTCITFY